VKPVREILMTLLYGPRNWLGYWLAALVGAAVIGRYWLHESWGLSLASGVTLATLMLLVRKRRAKEE
jgi:hypothetical protein